MPALPDGTGPAAIAIAPSGQIVVAGSVGVANDDGVPGEQIVVARFDATRRARPGVRPRRLRGPAARLRLGRSATRRRRRARSSLLPDGRIVIAGRASARDGGDRAFVARLTAAGAPRPRASRARAARSCSSAAPRRRASRARRWRRSRSAPTGGSWRRAARPTSPATTRCCSRGFTAGGRARRRVRAPRQRRHAARRGSPRRAPPASLARALALQPDGAAIVAGAATGGAARRALRRAPARWTAATARAGARSRSAAARFDAADRRRGGRGAAARRQAARRRPARRRRRCCSAACTAAPSSARPPSTRAAARDARRALRRPRARLRVRPRRRRLHGRQRALQAHGIGGRGRVVSTRVQRVFGRSGPQVVCAPLSGLRAGRLPLCGSRPRRGAARGASRVLRVPRAAPGALPHRRAASAWPVAALPGTLPPRIGSVTMPARAEGHHCETADCADLRHARSTVAEVEQAARAGGARSLCAITRPSLLAGARSSALRGRQPGPRRH